MPGTSNPWNLICGIQAICEHKPATYRFLCKQACPINMTTESRTPLCSVVACTLNGQQQTTNTGSHETWWFLWCLLQNHHVFFNGINRCILWAPHYTVVYFFNSRTCLRGSIRTASVCFQSQFHTSKILIFRTPELEIPQPIWPNYVYTKKKKRWSK